MTDGFDSHLIDQLRAKRHAEASQRLLEIELDQVKASVAQGDKKAMLEFLTITADALRRFDVLPSETRENIADGMESIVTNLSRSRGFSPRKPDDSPNSGMVLGNREIDDLVRTLGHAAAESEAALQEVRSWRNRSIAPRKIAALLKLRGPGFWGLRNAVRDNAARTKRQLQHDDRFLKAFQIEWLRHTRGISIDDAGIELGIPDPTIRKIRKELHKSAKDRLTEVLGILEEAGIPFPAVPKVWKRRR
jgi:hypothetical protein